MGSRRPEVLPREARCSPAKVDCMSMGEVREGLVYRLCRYVDVRCLNATHGGGKVGASYLSGAVVLGLKPGKHLLAAT